MASDPKASTHKLPAPELPLWLHRRDDGAFVVDADIAYPDILQHLGIAPEDVTQYWLEVAFQCAKLAVQTAIIGTALDPRPERSIVISIEGGDGYKERWSHGAHPPGRGIEAASKGLEAKRDHFPRIGLQLVRGMPANLPSWTNHHREARERARTKAAQRHRRKA